MRSFYIRYITISLVIVCSLSLLSVLIFGYSFIRSFLTLCTIWSGWLFYGHLITIDDDFPGAWSNPDGKYLMPWGELGIKFVVFLITSAVLFSL